MLSLPSEPAPDSDTKGVIQFPFGLFWSKGLSMKAGPANPIRDYQKLLKTLIESGKAKPSFVFDKEFCIEDGAKAYDQFSKHELIKAVFKF